MTNRRRRRLTRVSAPSEYDFTAPAGDCIMTARLAAQGHLYREATAIKNDDASMPSILSLLAFSSISPHRADARGSVNIIGVASPHRGDKPPSALNAGAMTDTTVVPVADNDTSILLVRHLHFCGKADIFSKLAARQRRLLA